MQLPYDEATMRAVGTKLARPEWTLRIEELRESLGLSQAGLARRLNVSPMAISRWERGINEPTSSIYIELGKMAGAPQCWAFWELAGLTRADVLSALAQDSAIGLGHAKASV
ncbi:MAG: hypothetical protein NVS9B15_02350 [Acidobacteriaceae bacterium]